MPRRASLRVVGAAILGSLLGACSTPKLPAAPGSPPRWSGRFSLTIQSEPVERWSAGFDLQGSATEGELEIHSPLGQRVALLQWTRQQAELQQGGQRTVRRSLDELTSELSGGWALPVVALFDWLRGRPSPVGGWEADLSLQPEGRVVARRLHPLPAAELRLVFEP